MKKIMIMFAVALTFAACNGVGEPKPVADSTAVDSLAVTANDSTVAQIPADSTAVADTTKVVK